MVVERLLYVQSKGGEPEVRKAARVALATVILMAAVALVTSGGGGGVSANAQIRQPTTLLSDILDSPKPDDDDDDGGGGSGGGGGGGSGGGGNGDKDDDGLIDKGGKKDDDKKKKGDRKDGKLGKGKKGGKRGKGKRGDRRIESIANRIPGAYSTRKLVTVATQLLGLGMSPAEVIRRVYPPFIIAGPASWIDTWHAPRYGPAPGQIRQHEGQDVFCDYGDPLLAPEPGIVSFSDGGLGGITARVHESDGSYWYLTHLSDLNTEQLSPGDPVGVGDVLGYCGNSGNASSTPPHVHFGWYQPNGKAKNPMRPLIDWLRAAQRRVLGVVSKKTAQKAKRQPIFTAARRFGDAFAPDRSEFRLAGESLWASGSDPGIGTYALAEAALRAALATRGFDYSQIGQPVDLHAEHGDDIGAFLDPDSALARLLENRHIAVTEVGD